jgi:CubicO group peptidase (beta-lactamase class C family)
MSLSNTVFTLSAAQHDRLARFYRGSEWMPDEYVNAFASGGLYSSVTDLARWMRFLLGYGTFDGVTVLSSNSLEAIWTPQASHVKLSYAEHLINFGLGWDQVTDQQFAYASPRACWKNGGAEGYGSFVMVIPEQQLGVVVLNSYSGDGYAQPAARLAMARVLEDARGLFAPTNTPVLPTTPGARDDDRRCGGHHRPLRKRQRV